MYSPQCLTRYGHLLTGALAFPHFFVLVTRGRFMLVSSRSPLGFCFCFGLIFYFGLFLGIRITFCFFIDIVMFVYVVVFGCFAGLVVLVVAARVTRRGERGAGARRSWFAERSLQKLR